MTRKPIDKTLRAQKWVCHFNRFLQLTIDTRIYKKYIYLVQNVLILVQECTREEVPYLQNEKKQVPKIKYFS